MRRPERPTGALRRLAAKLERGALRVLVLSLAALAAFQYIYGQRVQTTFLPDPALVENWPQGAETAAGRVEIMLVSQPAAPGVELLVNGRRVGDFAAGRLSVQVNDGDALAIDARSAPETLAFCVVGITPRVLRPSLGDRFAVRAQQIELPAVRVGPQPASSSPE